ncbi:MAG: pyridoxal-dependent decarboxylase [Jiangellales bacterium]
MSHMSPEEFRTHGHRLVDWVADYWESLDSRPVHSDVLPGDIRALLPEHAPEQPEAFDAVLDDLDRVVAGGLTHWQAPGWFAYFPANASFPSILGELAAAGLGQQGMLWSTSPAATEIEAHVLDWLVDLLGLPETFTTTGRGGGVMQMSASDSTHTALVVAREQARGRTDGDGRHPSIDDLVVYASTQAHSSVEKGARVAGYRHVRLVDVDEAYAMRPDALAAAVESDVEAGLTPAVIVSTVGTTGTTALDPLRAIAAIARPAGMWHHVDAAYAGSAMICPELRWMQDGVDLVDSYTFNPHKWMFTNFDANVLYVADRAPLLATLSILPPYLRNAASESGAVIDYRDWHVPLGRRFRALKLWFALRSYGADGIRHHIREHIAWAATLRERLDADPRFTLMAPSPLALVTFRHSAGAEATQRLVEAINTSGHSYVTASVLDDEPFVRVSIGATTTREQHVDRLWHLIDDAAEPAVAPA